MPKILINKKKIFIAIFISLILIICVLCANFLSLLLVQTESYSSSVSSPSFELYLLSISKSQLKQESLSFCSQYQEAGAGGYVWQLDDYYHVISSAYLNKNDAVLVQNSLNNNEIKSEILTIKFNNFSVYGSFENESTKILNKAINCPLQLYKQLYDIAISIDTSVYNEISARIAVNDEHNALCSTIDNFSLLFGEDKDENIVSIKSLLLNIQKISQKLCGGTLLNNNQTYASLVKYRYLEILKTYYDFLNK